MKPGDMIEWVYKHNSTVVDKDEELWSTLMYKWIPIGTPAILISVTEHECFWLSEKGLFSASSDDTLGHHHGHEGNTVVPRRVCII